MENNKDDKKVLGIYLEKSLISLIEIEAKKNRRSKSAQLAMIVEEWAENRKAA